MSFFVRLISLSVIPPRAIHVLTNAPPALDCGRLASRAVREVPVVEAAQSAARRHSGPSSWYGSYLMALQRCPWHQAWP